MVPMDLNPLTQIKLATMGATAVIFLATYAGLRKFFVLPYLAVMRERETMVEEAQGKKDEADELLTSSRSSADAQLAEARAEADRLLAEAREQSLESKREQIATATRDASTRLETGRAEIAKERERALAMMRAQAVECVGMACQQLLGSVDERSIGEAVDKIMTRYAQ